MGMQPVILGVSLGYGQYAANSFSSGLFLKNVAPTTSSSLSTTVPGIPAGTCQVLVYDETATMRWTDDGVTTPTSTVGNPVTAGQALIFTSSLPNLQIYGPSAVVNVTYYRNL